MEIFQLTKPDATSSKLLLFDQAKKISLRKNHNDDDNTYIHQPCENYSPTLQLPQNHHSYSTDVLVTVT
jgi:hypothetical protein